MPDSSSNDLWSSVKVAERLVALRLALDLNKADFADQIGIDRSSYTKIEKGQKPLLVREASEIWRLYGVDMNYIYLGQIVGLPGILSSKVIKNLKTPHE